MRVVVHSRPFSFNLHPDPFPSSLPSSSSSSPPKEGHPSPPRAPYSPLLPCENHPLSLVAAGPPTSSTRTFLSRSRSLLPQRWPLRTAGPPNPLNLKRSPLSNEPQLDSVPASSRRTLPLDLKRSLQEELVHPRRGSSLSTVLQWPVLQQHQHRLNHHNLQSSP